MRHLVAATSGSKGRSNGGSFRIILSSRVSLDARAHYAVLEKYLWLVAPPSRSLEHLAVPKVAPPPKPPKPDPEELLPG